MPRIAAVATRVPPYRMTQVEARRFAAQHFGAHREDLGRLLPVFENAGIASRYFCMGREWFSVPKSFPEKNALYIEWSTRLGAEVVRACIDEAGLSLTDIDHLVFVSTTGLATPSIDARLLNLLDLRPDVVRTPIWGLGCAGGAAGLALAYRLAKAESRARVMLVAVELCGLTFQYDDYSKANLVATALFADGAAGALVVGDDVPIRANGSTPAIVDARSTTWPDSLDVMGWSFDAVGMQVVFSRAIPGIVRREVKANIEAFLDRNNLPMSPLPHLVTHPGGIKVITAYEEALGLGNGAMQNARDILRDYGNMSSPTVLFVLKRFLESREARPGDHAILTALGPGFSAESILLRF